MSEGESMALYARVYDVVDQVPPGRVATYGDIAAIVSSDARTVGYALNALPKERSGTVPWQRIINASGGISTRGVEQRRLLEAEGVVFDARGRLDLKRYRWDGPDPEWSSAHHLSPLLRSTDEDEAQGQQLPLF